MMHWKKLLALLLSAALALSLLAGCGSGQQSAAQALLKLLDGQYQNVSVEMDKDLEAGLRRVLRENETGDEAAIRAALETAAGSTVTFRNLRNGQQGDTAFDLVFYAGSDPDKAARAAYSQWNPVFSRLPADGKYTAGLALVETGSGVWLAVKGTVEKAGTPDKEEEPEDDGFLKVSTPAELKEALSTDSPDTPAKIRLTADFTLDASLDHLVFYGELDGNGKTITIPGGSVRNLFGSIGERDNPMGKVEHLTIQAAGSISGSAGILAGSNWGEISGCHVRIGSGAEINGSENASGIAGENNGRITGCTVTVEGTISGQGTMGGAAGCNQAGGVISGCRVTVSEGGSIGTDNGGEQIGGIAGINLGSIQDGCTVTVAGTLGHDGDSFVGGIAGINRSGTISGCKVEVTGSITGQNTIGGIAGSVEGSGSGDADTGSSALSGCTVILRDSGAITAANGTIGGIAGKILSDRIIRDCRVTIDPNARIASTGDYAGGIAGRSNGAYGLEDCRVELAGTISARDSAGGIIGYNSIGCAISGCEVTVTGSIRGNRYIGGVAGENSGRITRCTVTVKPSGQITSVYSTGGIAGNSDGMHITDCTVNVNNIGQISNMIDGIGGIAGSKSDADFPDCTVNTGAAGESAGGAAAERLASLFAQ